MRIVSGVSKNKHAVRAIRDIRFRKWSYLSCLSVNIVYEFPVNDRCIAKAIRTRLRIPMRELETVYLSIGVFTIYL